MLHSTLKLAFTFRGTADHHYLEAQKVLPRKAWEHLEVETCLCLYAFHTSSISHHIDIVGKPSQKSIHSACVGGFELRLIEIKNKRISKSSIFKQWERVNPKRGCARNAPKRKPSPTCLRESATKNVLMCWGAKSRVKRGTLAS